MDVDKLAVPGPEEAHELNRRDASASSAGRFVCHHFQLIRSLGA